jgi:hypothetical protein
MTTDRDREAEVKAMTDSICVCGLQCSCGARERLRAIERDRRHSEATEKGTPMSTTDGKSTQHGIADAYYDNASLRSSPTLACLCGWRTRSAKDWEDAGGDLDEHIADCEGPQ